MTPDDDKFNISTNIIYELSISPDDTHQYATKGDTRVQNVKSDVQSIFGDFHKNIKYHLFCEVSNKQFGNKDSNRLCRVHWHGIVVFTSNAAVWDWITIRWQKLTAFCTVQLNLYGVSQTGQHPDRAKYWDEYVRKQTWLVPRQYRIMNHKYQDIKNFGEVLQTESLDESSQDSLPKGKSEAKPSSGKRRRKAAAGAKRKE